MEEKFMKEALKEAKKAYNKLEVPVGAVIVKDGKITCGFSPSIMTTTIFELLSSVKEIGNDISFTNLSSASPELLIENISIAGNK